MLTSSGGRLMLTVADRGRAVGKICQNLADVICEIQINDIEICTYRNFICKHL